MTQRISRSIKLKDYSSEQLINRLSIYFPGTNTNVQGIPDTGSEECQSNGQSFDRLRIFYSVRYIFCNFKFSCTLCMNPLCFLNMLEILLCLTYYIFTPNLCVCHHIAQLCFITGLPSSVCLCVVLCCAVHL